MPRKEKVQPFLPLFRCWQRDEHSGSVFQSWRKVPSIWKRGSMGKTQSFPQQRTMSPPDQLGSGLPCILTP